MSPHIGVEVEVEYNTQDAFARGIALDNAHRDGSLGTYGAEYKLLAKATEIADIAAELVHEVWKRGARAGRKCGLHVHLDVRQLPPGRVDEMRHWFYRTQETWFSIMPPSRRANRYVQRMEPAGAGGDYHYTWAHKSDYDTFEVRIHGGTLNPFKMRGWLSALCHIQAKANDATYAFPSTGDAQADFWSLFQDCPLEGREYMMARAAGQGRLPDGAFRSIEE